MYVDERPLCGRRNHHAFRRREFISLRLPLDRVAQLLLCTPSACEADNSEFGVVARKPQADIVRLGVGLSRDRNSTTERKKPPRRSSAAAMFFPSREGPNHRETSFVGNMLTNLALNRADPGLDILDRVSFSAHSFPSFSKRLSSPPAVSLGRRDFAPAGWAWVIQAPGTPEFQIFLFFSRESGPCSPAQASSPRPQKPCCSPPGGRAHSRRGTPSLPRRLRVRSLEHLH